MTKCAANEICVIREYGASIKSVWEAWTDSNQTDLWWGARGFTTSTQSKDIRKGGKWVYTMRGTDGKEYPNMHFYHEAKQFSELLYDHGGGDGKIHFKVHVQFNEIPSGTKMVMKMIFPTVEAANESKKFVKAAGGETTWDRLGEFLEFKIHNRETFLYTRSFSIDINTAFDAWTDPKKLAEWMGPKGSEMGFIRADIFPNGSTFYYMNSGGTKMYGRTEYQAIERPNLIAYSQQFCDEKEKPSRHPLAATWPLTMMTKITFASESPTETRIAIQWTPLESSTAEEISTFASARIGMTGGWRGSFDKLEEYFLK